MPSMVKILICFIFASFPLFSFSLKDKLSQAEEGAYIVTEQRGLISLLHLHTKKEGEMVFEEISVPNHLIPSMGWKEWVRKGAPGHTSWTLYTIDTKTTSLTQCYSKSRKAWLPTNEVSSFFVPMIHLTLHPLSETDRLKRGASSNPGAVQSRLWGPPQVIDGKRIPAPEYTVYTAKWPTDHTPLSGKMIVVYFDNKRPNFPFPYWVQIREGAAKFRLRAIDSGIGLTKHRQVTE